MVTSLARKALSKERRRRDENFGQICDETFFIPHNEWQNELPPNKADRNGSFLCASSHLAREGRIHGGHGRFRLEAKRGEGERGKKGARRLGKITPAFFYAPDADGPNPTRKQACKRLSPFPHALQNYTGRTSCLRPTPLRLGSEFTQPNTRLWCGRCPSLARIRMPPPP